MGEAVAQLGGALEVVDGQEGVLVAHVADAGLVELAGQPLAAVDVDLDLVGDPALDAHVHEAELGVDQVHVVVQALALAPGHLDAVGLVALADLEAHAGLHRADEAHDPLGDPVLLGDGLGQVVLHLGPVAGLDVVKGDARTARLGRQAVDVVGDAVRRGLGVLGEVGDRVTLGPQEGPHRVGLEEVREVTLEDHPVEHGQAAGDVAAVNVLEAVHGGPPCWCVASECASCRTARTTSSSQRPTPSGAALPPRHRPVARRRGHPRRLRPTPAGVFTVFGCGRRLR